MDSDPVMDPSASQEAIPDAPTASAVPTESISAPRAMQESIEDPTSDSAEPSEPVPSAESDAVPEPPQPQQARAGSVPRAGSPAAPAANAASTSSASSSASTASGSNLDKLFQRMNLLAKDGKWDEMANVVRSHEDIMVKRCGDLEQFIVTCDPAKHTSAIIFALSVICNIAEKKKIIATQERCYEILKHFLETRELVVEQLMTVIDIYCAMFYRLHDFCLHVKKEPAAGIPIMIAGIEQITERGSGMLTSLHGHLFSLAVYGGQPELALPYLEDIRQILNENLAAPLQPSAVGCYGNAAHLDAKHVLRYLYFGADVALRSGHAQRASALLLNLITFPASAMTMLLLAGHKKWVVLQLLLGNDATPPMTRSVCLVRAWRDEGEAYSKLATAVKSGKNPVVEVEKILAEHQKLFEKDGLVELVREVAKALVERAVLKVAKCFSSIRLADVARRAGVSSADAAREHCERLTSEGRLEAQFEGDVVHLKIPTRRIDEGMVEAALGKVDSSGDVTKRVHNAVQCHPVFLSRTMRVSGYMDDEGLSMSMGTAQTAMIKD